MHELISMNMLNIELENCGHVHIFEYPACKTRFRDFVYPSDFLKIILCLCLFLLLCL